jgi:nuclear pore complex protein Nup133
MFSAEAPSHTHSLRPKRSRQAASDDSIKFPQAKRKRSALRRDTFEPLTDASINEIAGHSNVEAAPSAKGHTDASEKEATPVPNQSRPLTLRGGKKADKRLDRAGGALTLSSNDFYNVTQLPALPDRIRGQPAIPYSSIFSSEYGYALALSHTDALLWAYNSPSSTPVSRDLLCFKLPFLPASVEDPLPLAAFTARTAAGEPGIVAVSATSGKVVYWETVTIASSVVPGQTSSGVQGSIPGLLSDETVKEIINAEPSGFILTFSHGRVAHLAVRDQVGRPHISVQWMRKTMPAGNIFGSIRNVFVGDRRKGIPIVRAGRSSKGQRDVLVGSESGDLEFWNTNLSSGNSLTKAVSIKEDLLEALKHNLPSDSSVGLHFKILDFEIVAGPSSNQSLAKRSEEAATPLTVLAALNHQDDTTYYIIELTITGDRVSIQVVHNIKCYKDPFGDSKNSRPRLCIPKPCQVAFVIFDTAIVLYSMARMQESPSSQLMMERNALPDPFQDCIRFQDDAIYRVLGYAVEEEDPQNKHPACVLAIQGFGVVRVTSTVPQGPTEDDDEVDLRISAKTKIEQAVFYGTNRQNPLNLTSSTSGQSFTAEEISSAALEVSGEILGSKSKYLPKSTPSIDVQMRLRAKAFEDLIHYLLKFHPSSLSRRTRYQLLLNAEKLAAAQSLWKTQEDIQRRYQRDGTKREFGTYLQFVLLIMPEDKQTYPEAAKGETDSVRHWLTYDPPNIQYLLAALAETTQRIDPHGVVDPSDTIDYHCEAADLWCAAYDAALKFRENYAPSYGLPDEIFQNGVLQTAYPDGPEIWTSDKQACRVAIKFVNSNCDVLEKYWVMNAAKRMEESWPLNEEGDPYEAPSESLLLDLARRLPDQVQTSLRLAYEHDVQDIHDMQAKTTDPKKRAKNLALIKSTARSGRRSILTKISKYNMSGAIAIAETIADPGLLVTLSVNHIKQLIAEGAAHPDRVEAINTRILDVQNRTETYFERFGNGWAFAHFSRMIEDGDLGVMLTEVQEAHEMKQPYLTWYFKKCLKLGQPVGKVSWINDVLGEQNFHRAGKTLEAVASKEEHDAWNKKTELSLAKLASLAASEATGSATVAPQPNADSIRKFDDAIKLLDIQDQLFTHVQVKVGPTIDAKASQDLALKEFGVRIVDKHPASKKLLKQGLDRLLGKQTLAPQQLVDVLTLMDPDYFAGNVDDDPQVFGHEFFLALKVIDLAPNDAMDHAEKQRYRRTVWRRAMIRDDWLILNETSLKDDRQVQSEMEQSSLYRTLFELFEHIHKSTEATPALYSPQQILDAEVVPSENEHVDKKLEKELHGEQDRLRRFVEQGRLELHYGGLLATAERQVRSKANHLGDEIAEEVLKENGYTNGFANGIEH